VLQGRSHWRWPLLIRVDILLSLKGEDSYGVSLFLQDRFGGFLPQPPGFSGGPRRGLTFRISCGSPFKES
jgi:hypothetical protein